MRTELFARADPILKRVTCQDNQLTVLDVSNNPDLYELWCGTNFLTSLDLSSNTSLGSHKRDQYTPSLKLDEMPTLFEVCVWTLPFPPDDFLADTTDSPNLYFTTECSR